MAKYQLTLRARVINVNVEANIAIIWFSIAASATTTVTTWWWTASGTTMFVATTPAYSSQQKRNAIICAILYGFAHISAHIYYLAMVATYVWIKSETIDRLSYFKLLHLQWAYFIMTSLFFINNSVNPTVYLIYNTALRHEVCDCKHPEGSRKYEYEKMLKLLFLSKRW